MELMTANEKLNGLETSCEFLAEKCDALMTILKKHNKLSDERIDSVIADVNRARNEVRMKIRFAWNFVIFRRKVAKSAEKHEIRLHSFCTVLYDNQLHLDASKQYGWCDTLQLLLTITHSVGN